MLRAIFRTVAATALDMFGAGGLVKIAAVALFAVSALVGVKLYLNGLYRKGFDDALTSVSRQNTDAATAANKVKMTVAQCFDLGGEWNVASGSCDLPQ